jgi:hypothetical protein
MTLQQPSIYHFKLRVAVLGALGLFAQAAQADDSWAAYNRTINGTVNVTKRDYSEQDPFNRTSNGTLNTEHGSLHGQAIKARWQSSKYPLMVHTELARSTGGTNYNGFLQSGGLLTPYNNVTGNKISDMSVRVGRPIELSERVQWVPFVEIQKHNWQRQLTQYNEDFAHTAGLVGVQMQWRQGGGSANAATPWSLEAEAAFGKLLNASMSAPALSFNQSLGNGEIWKIGATVGYQITPQWQLTGSTTTRHFSYGKSLVQNQMLEPSSRTTETMVGLGLSRRY